MKILLFIVPVFVSIFAAYSGDLILAENGRTEYTITFSENSGDIEKYAVQELKFFLKQITGVDFPAGKGETGKRLIVGGETCNDIRECVIETSGGDIKLYGGGMHGALNAVYELIENQFGCMFLSAWGDLYIPPKNILKLSEGTRRIKYAFPCRAFITVAYKDKANMARTFYRNRLNLDLNTFNSNKSGEVAVSQEPGIVNLRIEFTREHSLSVLLPPGDGDQHWGFNPALPGLEKKQYFKNHPEWFSMDEEGKRVSNRQVCFSNPELKQELEKNTLALYYYLKKHTGIDGIMQISCNDIAYNMCFCPDCQTLQKKYRCAGAPLYTFITELAEKHPRISFCTSAYQREQTQAPPDGLTFPENLSLFFAPINSDFANAFVSGKNNQNDLEDITRWSKLTKRILVWYYPYPYNRSPKQFFLPPPTSILDRVAADLKLFRDLGIDGPYFENDSGGVSLCSNFTEMQAYVMAKLFQNPDFDVDQLIKKFISVYYGDGAAYVQKYHDELRNEMRKFTAGGGSWDYRTMDSPFLTKENLLSWEKLLEQAEKATAGDYFLNP